MGEPGVGAKQKPRKNMQRLWHHRNVHQGAIYVRSSNCSLYFSNFSRAFLIVHIQECHMCMTICHASAQASKLSKTSRGSSHHSNNVLGTIQMWELPFKMKFFLVFLGATANWKNRSQVTLNAIAGPLTPDPCHFMLLNLLSRTAHKSKYNEILEDLTRPLLHASLDKSAAGGSRRMDRHQLHPAHQKNDTKQSLSHASVSMQMEDLDNVCQQFPTNMI